MFLAPVVCDKHSEKLQIVQTKGTMNSVIIIIMKINNYPKYIIIIIMIIIIIITIIIIIIIIIIAVFNKGYTRHN